MSKHRAFIANGVFPWFRSTPSRYRSGSLSSRLKYVAGLVEDSGADCATFGEYGIGECLKLSDYLPWQYDRAQGTGRGLWQAGINSCWSDPDKWSQPESGLDDYVMPSAGQTPPRTLLLAELTELKGDGAKLTLGAFHETLTNTPGLSYVKAMIGHVGTKRGDVLLGGDFKRTQDSDDLAAMRKAGLTVHERIAGTPMACFTRGETITVQGVDHVSRPRAFDHEYLVVDFTITGKKAA